MDNESALDQTKAVHDDGWVEINGRRYTLGTFTHKKRLKIFAFLSSIAPALDVGNFGCLATPEFEPIEALITENTLFDGTQISKLPGHWDKYPEDYMTFITIVMGAISYPFMKGAA